MFSLLYSSSNSLILASHVALEHRDHLHFSHSFRNAFDDLRIVVHEAGRAVATMAGAGSVLPIKFQEITNVSDSILVRALRLTLNYS